MKNLSSMEFHTYMRMIHTYMRILFDHNIHYGVIKKRKKSIFLIRDVRF
jgi:hypothetical protein